VTDGNPSSCDIFCAIMKGRIKATRTARLCGLWALRERTRLPRDVRRYIGKFLEWDYAYCWVCLKRYRFNLNWPQATSIPQCNTWRCYPLQCSGGHNLNDANIVPRVGHRGVRISTWGEIPPCDAAADHVKEMLEAFDFFCTLSKKAQPDQGFGLCSQLQRNAVRLARDRKQEQYERARKLALREQSEAEREEKEHRRAMRQEQRGGRRGRRGK